jgi:hypothetical protein
MLLSLFIEYINATSIRKKRRTEDTKHNYNDNNVILREEQ